MLNSTTNFTIGFVPFDLVPSHPRFRVWVWIKWMQISYIKENNAYVLNSMPTWKFGGIIVFPAGIWRTIFSPSKSQRSHLEWLISRAHGRSSIRRVFTHGFHTDSLTLIGLSHWVSCSLLIQVAYQRRDKRQLLIPWQDLQFIILVIHKAFLTLHCLLITDMILKYWEILLWQICPWFRQVFSFDWNRHSQKDQKASHVFNWNQK